MDEYIGERIRNARKQLKMRQEDLAKELGIAKITLSSYERDITKPPLSVVRKLNNILGINLTEYSIATEDTSKAVSSVTICRALGYIVKKSNNDNEVYFVEDGIRKVTLTESCLMDMYDRIQFELYKTFELLCSMQLNTVSEQNLTKVDNNDALQFAKKLKQIRINNKINQNKFAKYLGISLRSLQYYESCTRVPSYDIICKINDNLEDLLSSDIIQYNSDSFDLIDIILRSFKIVNEHYIDNESVKYIRIKSPESCKCAIFNYNKFKDLFISIENMIRYIVKDKLKSAEKEQNQLKQQTGSDIMNLTNTNIIEFDYMEKNEVMAHVVVNYAENKVIVENYTDDLFARPFGVNENPSIQDFENFLESRCFPKTRRNCKQLLRDLDVPYYSPILIVQKTHGRQYEDFSWIRFKGEKGKINYERDIKLRD